MCTQIKIKDRTFLSTASLSIAIIFWTHEILRELKGLHKFFYHRIYDANSVSLAEEIPTEQLPFND